VREGACNGGANTPQRSILRLMLNAAALSDFAQASNSGRRHETGVFRLLMNRD
jgi:hypothetical protein